LTDCESGAPPTFGQSSRNFVASLLEAGQIISAAAVGRKHPKPKQDASMTKNLPTVGRVVWFTPSRLTGAAIVSHVFSDELVPEHGCFCEWMHYQVVQAAKAGPFDIR
jgi:hypothetical protein